MASELDANICKRNPKCEQKKNKEPKRKKKKTEISFTNWLLNVNNNKQMEFLLLAFRET